jgi:hypothetical protein
LTLDVNLIGQRDFPFIGGTLAVTHPTSAPSTIDLEFAQIYSSASVLLVSPDFWTDLPTSLAGDYGTWFVSVDEPGLSPNWFLQGDVVPEPPGWLILAVMGGCVCMISRVCRKPRLASQALTA